MSEVTTVNFLELLQDQGDKATLNDLVEAGKYLPKHIVMSIPACLYDAEGALDEEALIVLAWVRAKRDNPDMTKEEVGDRIGNHAPEALTEIMKELVYFYTTQTREEIAERYRLQAETDTPTEPDELAEAGEPQENPTD